MKFKKSLAALLVGAMILTGCSGKKDATKDKKSETKTEEKSDKKSD